MRNLIAIFMLTAAIGGAAVPAAAQGEAAQKAKDAAEEVQFQEALASARAVKRSMKNPASSQLDSVMRTPAGATCYQYRARNSFNAIVPGFAVAAEKKLTISDAGTAWRAVWNRHCGGKSGTSLSHVAFVINKGL